MRARVGALPRRRASLDQVPDVLMTTLPERRGTCVMCRNTAVYKTVPPAVQGAVAVDVLVCGICDRRQCDKCLAEHGQAHYVQDPRATRCTRGHHLFGT